MKFNIGEKVRIIKTGEIDTIIGATSITHVDSSMKSEKVIGYSFLNYKGFPLTEDKLEKIEEEGSNPTYINIDNQILFDKSLFDTAKINNNGNTVIYLKDGSDFTIAGNHIYEIDFKLRQ